MPDKCDRSNKYENKGHKKISCVSTGYFQVIYNYKD